jgi:hypothetical protein
MINNSTNIKKRNNHLSHQTIQYKKDHDICRLKPRFGAGTQIWRVKAGWWDTNPFYLIIESPTVIYLRLEKDIYFNLLFFCFVFVFFFAFHSILLCLCLLFRCYIFVLVIVALPITLLAFLNVHVFIPPLPEGGGDILLYLCPSVRPSVRPSVQDIFRRIFLSNCWWQKSDIWSQASYRYAILWVAFLDPSDSYFLFADLLGFYTHWTYMHIFRHLFLSNYWWQKSDIWSQASYRYAILWVAFLDPSDSYFLFADFVDFNTHWTYMLIFRRIFLINYW